MTDGSDVKNYNIDYNEDAKVYSNANALGPTTTSVDVIMQLDLLKKHYSGDQLKRIKALAGAELRFFNYALELLEKNDRLRRQYGFNIDAVNTLAAKLKQMSVRREIEKEFEPVVDDIVKEIHATQEKDYKPWTAY